MKQLPLEVYNMSFWISISIVISMLIVILVYLLKKRETKIKLSVFKLLEIEIQFGDSKKQ